MPPDDTALAPCHPGAGAVGWVGGGRRPSHPAVGPSVRRLPVTMSSSPGGGGLPLSPPGIDSAPVPSDLGLAVAPEVRRNVKGQAAAALPPFTELVSIAYVSVAKAMASALRSSTSLLLLENVSQAAW